MSEQNLVKLQHFFEVDMRIKTEMYNMAPPADGQYLDEDTLCRYTDKVDNSLRYIFSELKCIATDVFGIDSIVFNRIAIFEEKTKNAFYSCGLDIHSLRAFYKNFISNMSMKFINSVKKECIGYSPYNSIEPIELAFSVNEILHFLHSYILNNSNILHSIPLIHEKKNEFGYSISFRGYKIDKFEQLFNLFPTSIDVGWTDMVAVSENKLLMMVRDRGHALTIEITLDNNVARLDYFIPKLCNIDMINNLPGVNKVNEESVGATGAFEVDIESLPSTLFDFISKVPMDSDMVFKIR